jgi:hypothetical protein
MEDGVFRHSTFLTSVYLWLERRLRGQSSLGNRTTPLSLVIAPYLNRNRYGTPFLLSLGISEQFTSLVWLAGPISGFIAQPVIGEHSQALTFNTAFTKWRGTRCDLRLVYVQVSSAVLDSTVNSCPRGVDSDPSLLPGDCQFLRKYISNQHG